MSKDWVADIKKMHQHYGVNNAVDKMTAKQLLEYFDFRVKFLQEELTELINSRDPADAIDAIIDLCVVAIGTLDAFDVDAYDAWDRVLEANMKKKVGVKESRPNPLGLPDLIKPEGWVAPNHLNNRSLLDFTFLEMWTVGK
jgi:predicted HAD superfamily Cof-like phosphohydrolase